jgi:threonine dehydratase
MEPRPADVLAAAERLRGKVRRTPLVPSPWLSSVTGAEIWLKLENQQHEGSFKARGAFNALMQCGVPRAVTASAGNHGRAMAFAARALGIGLTVFTPRTAPRAKLDPIRAHGATLELCDSYDEAERRAIAHARQTGEPYISPYNHRDVIAGAGTVGLEVVDDLPRVDGIVAGVGGGGLVSGVGLASQAVAPHPGVVGVEAAASPVFTTSLAAGHLVDVDVRPTLADGLAGNAEPGSVTFDLVRDLKIPVHAVDEDQIRAAMVGLLAHDGQRAEGAGAVAAAALVAGMFEIRGRRVAVIVSGGNVDR